MPEALVAEFSTRSRHIDVETDRLIEEYVTSHRRRPRPVTIMRLRAQATLATRPAKQVHSLADLTAAWRERATRVLRHGLLTVAQSPPVLLRAEDLPREAVDALNASLETLTLLNSPAQRSRNNTGSYEPFERAYAGRGRDRRHRSSQEPRRTDALFTEWQVPGDGVDVLLDQRVDWAVDISPTLPY
ncbi:MULTISPECIES: relaxase domain-containing protein [Cryobacterium]|uniref:relaxase domain-containing protein n=1 Tax=Cryobacterium TaxID=69578 RepID=UPI0030D274B0